MNDYVDLSIGRVFFKPLNYKILTNAKIIATIKNEDFNNELFFHLIELKAVRLRKRQLNRLSVKDSQKLREKTKEILFSYGVIEKVEFKKTLDKSTNGFTDKENAQFDEMLDESRKKKNVFQM